MTKWERKTMIAPSILSADFGNLEAEISQLDPELVDLIHVDVMDGQFVPNITIGPDVVKAVKRMTSIPLDVHLMIINPDAFIPKFVEAGAKILTIHAEATHHLHRSLQLIRQCGARAGVSLNPATPLSALDHVLPDLDLILLMTVNPGFGGQKFIPQMISKIKDCREIVGDAPIDIEVDGGIKLSNIDDIFLAGANIFVSGSGIFEKPPYNDTVQQMKEKLKRAHLKSV
jgi:ribulose-phosphate 3-epimerase